MKVAFKNRSAQVQERTRHRLQVAINQIRIACSWDWAMTNEHCQAEFGAIVQDMGAPALYRFLKGLHNLRKFQIWKGNLHVPSL
jgi:hypothetical protein